MSFSAQDVMKLRHQTGAGLMSAKKALTEANGDFEAAKDILKKSGEAKAAKKADRETTEGAIMIKVSDDNQKGALVSVYCETDFVAKNEDFQKFINTVAEKALNEGVDAAQNYMDENLTDVIATVGENIQRGKVELVEAPYVTGYLHGNGKASALIGLDKADDEAARSIAMHAAATSPRYLVKEEVSQDDIEKEKPIWEEQLRAEGKPEDIIGKIIEGKANKFASENALMEQDFVMDPSQSVRAYVQSREADVVAFAQENI